MHGWRGEGAKKIFDSQVPPGSFWVFVPLLVWGGVTIIWADWWRPHRLIDLKFIHTRDIFQLVKISSTLEMKAKRNASLATFGQKCPEKGETTKRPFAHNWTGQKNITRHGQKSPETGETPKSRKYTSNF